MKAGFCDDNVDHQLAPGLRRCLFVSGLPGGVVGTAFLLTPCLVKCLAGVHVCTGGLGAKAASISAFEGSLYFWLCC